MAKPKPSESKQVAPDPAGLKSATKGEPKRQAVLTVYPPPNEVPAEALMDAELIVRAKPVRGRWRAGRHFTREAVMIPLAALGEAERVAIAGDPELIVVLRLWQPG